MGTTEFQKGMQRAAEIADMFAICRRFEIGADGSIQEYLEALN
jgi:hypothetical protein